MKKSHSQIDEDQKIHIIYINGGIMDLGGISSYMMNYFRYIDHNKFQIDFIVHGDETGVYDEEIEENGSHIYRIPVKSKNYLKNKKELKKIFLENKYAIVHSHLDAGNYHILKIAKQCGIENRIAHSHNTEVLTNNKLKYYVNQFYRRHIHKVANICMACSQLAGGWLFGNDKKYIVIKNAIELKRFTFSEINRKHIRKKHNISDDYILIGHVGRFDKQKNHEFLIRVFSKLLVHNSKYRLMLVGDGVLREKTEQQVIKLGIEDKVVFVGYNQNIESYYSAFDIFVLPSLFEGLGIVAIEAQANGIPCILADSVPDEAVVAQNVEKISIDSENQWIEGILKCCMERQNNYSVLVSAGYDISVEVEKLQNLYKKISLGKRGEIF